MFQCRIATCLSEYNFSFSYQAPGEIDPSFKVQYEKKASSKPNRNRNKPYTTNSEKRFQGPRPHKQSNTENLTDMTM